MDNVISVNHKRENVIEFDLTMEGVDAKGAEVKLMVETKDMEIGFKASKKEKDTWTVKVPKLPMLERTAYKFYIEVHVDGFFFEAFKGTFNVVGSAEVYSSEPKNVTLKSGDEKKEDKKSEKKEEKKKVSETWRSREKSIEQIANELLEQHKYDPKAVQDKVEQLNEQEQKRDTTKDERVLAILEEAGIRPKGKEKKPRISFIKTKTLN